MLLTFIYLPIKPLSISSKKTRLSFSIFFVVCVCVYVCARLFCSPSYGVSMFHILFRPFSFLFLFHCFRCLKMLSLLLLLSFFLCYQLNGIYFVDIITCVRVPLCCNVPRHCCGILFNPSYCAAIFECRSGHVHVRLLFAFQPNSFLSITVKSTDCFIKMKFMAMNWLVSCLNSVLKPLMHDKNMWRWRKIGSHSQIWYRT